MEAKIKLATLNLCQGLISKKRNRKEFEEDHQKPKEKMSFKRARLNNFETKIRIRSPRLTSEERMILRVKKEVEEFK